jgi:hypothetical protein
MVERIVGKRGNSDGIKFLAGSTAREVLDALQKYFGLRGHLVHQDGTQLVDINVSQQCVLSFHL